MKNCQHFLFEKTKDLPEFVLKVKAQNVPSALQTCLSICIILKMQSYNYFIQQSNTFLSCFVANFEHPICIFLNSTESWVGIFIHYFHYPKSLSQLEIANSELITMFRYPPFLLTTINFVYKVIMQYFDTGPQFCFLLFSIPSTTVDYLVSQTSL